MQCLYGERNRCESDPTLLTLLGPLTLINPFCNSWTLSFISATEEIWIFRRKKLKTNWFASQQGGPQFNSRPGPFCVEFACSPCVCVGSFRILGVVQDGWTDGFIDGMQKTKNPEVTGVPLLSQSTPFKVVFDFEAQDDGVLMFKGGDILQALKKTFDNRRTGIMQWTDWHLPTK